jgi:CheY-like chemotaxis protein
VFDLFQQGERALDGSDGGLGIGLTLVRSLVEMHGGQVSASSPGPGQGATFTVRLPLAQEFAAGRPAAVTPVAEQTASANGMPVLVVEDDAAVAASMVGLLELVGYEVRTAGTGRAALQVLENFRPRVVLLDIRMPGEDGYSVARRIRQLPGGDAMLLVALTGYGHDEALRRAAEAGFDRHLAKPVEPDELLELLAETAKSAA